MPNDLTRVELRLPTQSLEIRDLGQLAEKVRWNASRRGEAATYIIQMWSRVLHGEISPTTFWDLFGVRMPQLYSVLEPSMAPTPTLAVSPPDIPDTPVEDPEAAKNKQKRERVRRNREAATWEP